MKALTQTTILKSLITAYQDRWLDEFENENDLDFQLNYSLEGGTNDGWCSIVELVEADTIEFGTLRGAVYETKVQPWRTKTLRRRLQRTT
ncbi:hypothetical protein TWF718_001530 [Orbilia javanica]|uniref:Uncharacterized protein n=1 Tax=Orbilia javanica TaxID=47235 RepID=A0AAN8N5I2_9PEZI